MRLASALLSSSAAAVVLSACGADSPAPRGPAHPEVIVAPSAPPAEQLRAWRACQRLAPAPEADGYYSCLGVNEALRHERRYWLTRIYDPGFVAIHTQSCKEAAEAVATLERVIDRVVAADGTLLPTWAELGEAKYASQREPDDVDPRAALRHAVALVRCRDAESLARLFDAYGKELAVPRHRMTAPLSLDSFAAAVATVVPRDAFATCDRDPTHAPAALARALAKAERPPRCPSTSGEVVALMRDPSPAKRVMGCECTNELAEAERRAASVVRDDVIKNDPASEERGGSSPAPITDFPAAFGLVLIGPLALRSLATGQSHVDHPVRDACFHALPIEGTPSR